MSKSRKDRFDQIQNDIQSNIARAHYDRRKRNSALKQLEKLGPQPRRVCVYFCQRDKSLSQYDVLPFYNMLKSVGVVQNLDLIVVNNGGDGTAAETMLDLCRRYCTGSLRVVVPLYAKSAATLLALGADEIVMGETSELGPIDAQVFVMQDNHEQQVSADHFLRARNDAITGLGSPNQAEATAAHIQLSLLGPAFLQHCSDLMQFAKDLAGKQLRAHMFKQEYIADAATCDTMIDLIVGNLTSSSKRLLHGRMITAEDILGDAELQKLKIKRLDSQDPYWLSLNELLLRTDIVARENNIGKWLFTSDFQLTAMNLPA